MQDRKQQPTIACVDHAIHLQFTREYTITYRNVQYHRESAEKTLWYVMYIRSRKTENSGFTSQDRYGIWYGRRIGICYIPNSAHDLIRSHISPMTNVPPKRKENVTHSRWESSSLRRRASHIGRCAPGCHHFEVTRVTTTVIQSRVSLFSTHHVLSQRLGY